MFQVQRYRHSRTRGQAKATVRHVYRLGLFGPYKVQYLLTVRCMYMQLTRRNLACVDVCTSAALAIKVPSSLFFKIPDKASTRTRPPVFSIRLVGLLVFGHSPYFLRSDLYVIYKNADVILILVPFKINFLGVRRGQADCVGYFTKHQTYFLLVTRATSDPFHVYSS